MTLVDVPGGGVVQWAKEGRSLVVRHNGREVGRSSHWFRSAFDFSGDEGGRSVRYRLVVGPRRGSFHLERDGRTLATTRV